MIEIELPPIPLRPKHPLKNRSVRGHTAMGRIQTVPAKLATLGEPGIEALARSRIDWSRIDLFRGLHLRRGQAVVLAGALALQR